MRVDLHIQSRGPSAFPCDMLERIDAQLTAPLGFEHEQPSHLLSQLKQIPQFVAVQAMRAVAALDASDVDHALIEIHLGPAHADSLAGPQAMTVDHADQYLIPEWIPAALARGLDQPASFIRPQILPIRHFRLFAAEGCPPHRLHPY